MVHNYITSKSLIERIYSDYNIQSDDFVSRLSTWTLNAIREIGIKQSYVLTNIRLELFNYKVCIPKEIDRIYAVKIKGMTADLNYNLFINEKIDYNMKSKVIGFDGKVYSHEPNILDDYFNVVTTIDTSSQHIIETDITPNPIYNAQYDNLKHTVFDINYWKGRTKQTYNYKVTDGWIHSNVEYGDIEIACGAIPYVYDEEFDMLFPLIPDDENLIKAITFYVLGQILMRGYKHPLLSYAINNEFLNPGMAWIKYIKLARNSCNAMSPDSKRTLSKLTGRNII